MVDCNQDYIGHRQRLKERFKKTGGREMPDYEVLEFLLTYAKPRCDVKPLAKQLIRKFGSFEKVISAPLEQLLNIEGIKEHSALLLKFIEFASAKMSWQNLRDRDAPYMSSVDNIIDFCRCSMGYSNVEVFRLIFVDADLKIIDTEILQTGSLTCVSLNRRDIISRTYAKNAAGIIMVHNHPSGNPKPSETDIRVTKNVEETCINADILFLDHIIITNSGYFSFLEHNLLHQKHL